MRKLNFKDRLVHFMSGRYGIDQLYYALLVAYFVLFIVNLFVRSPIISILMWVIITIAAIRVFSRNMYKRRMENEKFMKLWNGVKAKFSLTIRRIKEIKTHRFRKCPHCKAMLRLSRKKGKHTVHCPRCHKDFEQRTLW